MQWTKIQKDFFYFWKYDYSIAMVICYVHAFCHTISIFQVQLFHLYRAYKGYIYGSDLSKSSQRKQWFGLCTSFWTVKKGIKLVVLSLDSQKTVHKISTGPFTLTTGFTFRYRTSGIFKICCVFPCFIHTMCWADQVEILTFSQLYQKIFECR